MDETEGSYPAAHDASFGRCQVSTHAGPRCPGLRDVHPGQKERRGHRPGSLLRPLQIHDGR